VPVIASNRVGRETEGDSAITFYGNSFITDASGDIVKAADTKSETVLVHQFNLDALAAQRRAWGLFRDRRPDLYAPLLTKDGRA
jgi:N-carbamoylputrescine amidase